MALKKVIFHNEQDITPIIKADGWRMDVLRAAEELNLPDWWIGAGFLRNAIWDALEGADSPPTRDVDLVYFNKDDTRPETDWTYDERMKVDYPFAEWEVRNQARMHYVNNFNPYVSAADGIAHWVETATCVAVKLEGGKLHYLFCHGTTDLFGLVARPTPDFRSEELMHIFYERIQNKRWKEKWPSLSIKVK
jgi:hypothetical protein